VDNCAVCSTGVWSCDRCKAGFALSDGACSKCADNCLKCDTVGAGLCDDNSCKRGFTKMGSKCLKCSKACATCSSSDITVCLSCGEGSYLNSSSKC
jgi:hypothetical protein